MKTRSIAAGAVAILAVVAIVLTVVGYYGTQRRGPAPSTTASATSAPIPVSAGSVQAYYDQAIEWGVCADGTFDTFQGVNSSDASEYQCAFLKAPLDFYRISSRFTNSRFHPVLKRYRAHHGVD